MAKCTIIHIIPPQIQIGIARANNRVNNAAIGAIMSSMFFFL